jgi:hypothetical protein
MLLLLLSFCFAFEGLQPVAPEVFEEGLQVGQAFGARPVEAPGAVASFVHEPGLLQDGQMLRDRGPRDVEVRGDLAGGELVVPDEPEDLPAARLGDCLSAVSTPRM